ncbi:Six-hairpin glycosidase [Neurospora intermedia]|uniref:Six-hairpin glycosidase n=1 Tax=Neurospora intermedia TaxID=5142 RepID=A0ABR3DQ14_NEUIN
MNRRVSEVRDTCWGSAWNKSKGPRTGHGQGMVGSTGCKQLPCPLGEVLRPPQEKNPPVAGFRNTASCQGQPPTHWCKGTYILAHLAQLQGNWNKMATDSTTATPGSVLLIFVILVPRCLTAASAAEQSFSFLPRHLGKDDPVIVKGRDYVFNVTLFDEMMNAIDVMQEVYFQPWVGTWPSAIDWTAAVLGTHIAGTLETLHRSLEIAASRGIEISEGWSATENTISLYFSQLIGFYFGQNIFALRQEAFDDMLWVVLGWLDTTKFVDGYSGTSSRPPSDFGDGNGVEFPTETLRNRTWHGTLWTPAFAHRARIFWELAAAGWDTTLCGGGMNWNPRLLPYKNAITNELFIAASVMMYLHFPGDENNSPFISSEHNRQSRSPPNHPTNKKWYPHDPKYLAAAQDAYSWLLSSNMTNELGLYADGFHISGYSSGSNNTKCDERDEMLYTYNQGVLLTGQRNLFSVDPDPSYLKAGHTLIQNVIRATGWDLARDSPVDDLDNLKPGELPPWRGLGRAGILEEVCDAKGECSQDAQTFKGIWMHHFTAFCSPITQQQPQLRPTTTKTSTAPPPGPDFWKSIAKEHSAACLRYSGWLKHNAHAAARTRDSQDKFGMWWTAGLLNVKTSELRLGRNSLAPMEGVTDYRNQGVPQTSEWVPAGRLLHGGGGAGPGGTTVVYKDRDSNVQRPLTGSCQLSKGSEKTGLNVAEECSRKVVDDGDPNTRGRGRTVETQSGGLAVLRALWELSVQGE